MVRQVSEGYLLVTERSFRKLRRGDLDLLGQELEKLLREIRSTQPPMEDLEAVRQRNRRVQRLNTCRLMLRTFRARNRT